MHLNDVSGLLLLPPELRVNVLQHLDLFALLACRQTCRFLKNLVDDTPVLQYLIALARTGMCDNPLSSHTTHERIQKLTEYNDAWTNLRWTEHTTLPWPQASDPLYHSWALHDGIWAQAFASKIVFHQLPSRLRGIVSSRWEIKFPFYVEDFTFDASHDVLVVLESNLQHAQPPFKYTLHFRSLYTGEDHPSSKIPRLPIMPFDIVDTEPPELDYIVRIDRDRCGVLFRPGQPHSAYLTVLDWKTGVILWEKSSNARAFAFIGTHCLAILTSSAASTDMNVWLISDDVHFVSSFELPLFRQHENIHFDFHMNTGDPTPSSCSSNCAAPFSVDGADKLLTILYFVEDNSHPDFALYIRLSALLSRVEADIAEHSKKAAVTAYNWNDWAPDIVRLMSISKAFDHGLACGMRVINPKPFLADDDDGGFDMTVNDFHPYRLRNGPFGTLVSGDEELVDERDLAYPYDFRYCKQLPLNSLSTMLPDVLRTADALLFLLSDDNILIMEWELTLTSNPKIHLLTF
ncbi:hypothetical protein FA95DRAFT_1606411 [Auriscalpium vulgare]|uniref:Uncharacterized protein n=1 Tax=Auriscalpium vulgare TaxID=40419 RepID=A0ACB8RT87_9AGAM|nr:hypothetical protein FA95DRAFT_1606411 [Auriscalpium vulgare]